MKEIKIPIELAKALKANVADNKEVREYLQYALFDKENNALVATNGHSLFKADCDLSELPCSMLIKMPPAFFGERKEIRLKISDDYTPLPEDKKTRQDEQLLLEVGTEELLAAEGNPNQFPQYQHMLADNLSEYGGNNFCLDTGLLTVTAKTYGANEPIRFFIKRNQTGFATDAIIAIHAEYNTIFNKSQLVLMPLNV